MTKLTYKILFVTTLLIFILTAITLIYLRPTPSDEEIPRGSKRVEFNNIEIRNC